MTGSKTNTGVEMQFSSLITVNVDTELYHKQFVDPIISNQLNKMQDFLLIHFGFSPTYFFFFLLERDCI